MKKIIFKGSGTAIITPFTNDGINFEEFKKLIEFQIENLTDAIIVSGTTGESATMTLDEKKSLIKYAVEISNGRIPIIAGTGSNSTKNTIELSKYAESVGVDGLLLVSPYYNKTTEEGLIAHYKEIANNTSLPIILYNVPSRTGINITPYVCFKLSQFENIVAIKEASGNISQIAEIAALCKDNLNIYSGNDDQTIPILSLGGIGVISVLANIMPKEVHTMAIEYLNGNMKKAKEIQLDSLELTKVLFSEVNPIPVKAALNILGYNAGSPRLPLVDMSKEGKQNLRKQLANFFNIQ